MNVNDIIKSDLESTLVPRKMELIDEWTITHNDKEIDIDVKKVLSVTGKKNKKSKINLEENIEYFSHNTLNTLFEKEIFSLHRSILTNDPDFLKDKEDKKATIKMHDFDIEVHNLDKKKFHLIKGEYENIFGDNIIISDFGLVDPVDHAILPKDKIAVYTTGSNCLCFTDKDIGIVYLNNYFDPKRSTAHDIEYHITRSISDFSMKNYGLEYLGDIKPSRVKPEATIDSDFIVYDLLQYNKQKNKDFTKGYVALPFMLTSYGFLFQTEMYLPIRKTEVVDDKTRIVYNYLYCLSDLSGI